LRDGYDYLLGPIFLRLSATLTPDQAAPYGKTIGATEYHYTTSAATTTAPTSRSATQV
jgi:hypothetical protein